MDKTTMETLLGQYRESLRKATEQVLRLQGAVALLERMVKEQHARQVNDSNE